MVKYKSHCCKIYTRLYVFIVVVVVAVIFQLDVVLLQIHDEVAFAYD